MGIYPAEAGTRVQTALFLDTPTIGTLEVQTRNAKAMANYRNLLEPIRTLKLLPAERSKLR